MQKENLYTLIEQYLREELEEQDKTSFESEIASNPELAKEVQFQKELHTELENQKKQFLRAKLSEIGEEFLSSLPDSPSSKNGKWRNSISGLMLLALGVGAIWFLKQKTLIWAGMDVLMKKLWEAMSLYGF